VADFVRNQWPRSIGIGGRNHPEYAINKEIENSEEFKKVRRKHSAVESSINALENHGLDRCPDHGIDGFKRYVALAVVARNLQILGHMLQQKEVKSLRRQEKKARKAA